MARFYSCDNFPFRKCHKYHLYKITKNSLKMCINDKYLQCLDRENLTKRQRNLCSDKLSVNRDIICSILATLLENHDKPIKCLEGVGVCGTNGLLWKKYFGEKVDVTINGAHVEDYDVISKNVEMNALKCNVVKEDPCVLLRKNIYDFIFLNCKTIASWYFDSVFSTMNKNSILIITTSEDPSLYWQTSEVALRNYGGVIGKTSYQREISVRLVMAEMARTAAKYHKGLEILCTFVYKPEQSFTIVAKVKKGVSETNNSLQTIKKLAHCNLCEERMFIPNSSFLDKTNVTLSCQCSEKTEGRVILGIGPLWSGDIFNVEFIEKIIKCLNKYPWKVNVLSFLNLILDEAKCDESLKKSFSGKRSKTNHAMVVRSSQFYINTHKHNAKEFSLLKVRNIIKLLQKNGYCATRTHFDPEAIRTNASVLECINVLRQNFTRQNVSARSP